MPNLVIRYRFVRGKKSLCCSALRSQWSMTSFLPFFLFFFLPFNNFSLTMQLLFWVQLTCVSVEELSLASFHPFLIWMLHSEQTPSVLAPWASVGNNWKQARKRETLKQRKELLWRYHFAVPQFNVDYTIGQEEMKVRWYCCHVLF